MNAIVSGKAKTIETPKGPCNNYQEGEDGGGGAEKLEGGHYIKLLPR